jgi:DNA-binding GntR family transcriptional regulator
MVCNGLRAMLAGACWWVPSTVMDPDDPRRYVQVAASIRARIEQGDIGPGDPVPSITQLTQEHGVARQTAAKALKLLADDGLIRQYPGLGYFVAR